MIPASGAPPLLGGSRSCLSVRKTSEASSTVTGRLTPIRLHIEQWITSCVACPRSAVRPRRSLLRPPSVKLRMTGELCDRVIIPRIGYT